jgi:hypothetical protein
VDWVRINRSGCIPGVVPRDFGADRPGMGLARAYRIKRRAADPAVEARCMHASVGLKAMRLARTDAVGRIAMAACKE